MPDRKPYRGPYELNWKQWIVFVVCACFHSGMYFMPNEWYVGVLMVLNIVGYLGLCFYFEDGD